MKKSLITLAGISLASRLLACTCLGTSSPEETFAKQPIVALVEVKNVYLYPQQESRPPLVRHITLIVHKVYKGTIEDKEIPLTNGMCYQSIYLHVMHEKEKFILAFQQPQEKQMYVMPGCAHTGLRIIGNELYTYELTEEGGRAPKYHSKLENFKI